MLRAHLLLLPLSCALSACAGGKGDGAGGSDSTAEGGPLGDPVDLVAKVEPRIGSGGVGYQVGCGYPGPNLPFALAKPGPDTSAPNGAALGAYHGGGYHADDQHIQGFSHLHLYAVGLTDYGLLAVMPADGWTAPDGSPRTTEDGYRAPFSKDTEHAEVGLYEVTLDDTGVEVALTATQHTALHRYRFPPAVAEPTLIIDLGHQMEGGVMLASDLVYEPETGRARGSLRQDGAMSQPFTLWFELQVDPLPADWATWSDPAALEPGATSASAPAVDGGSGRSGLALRFPQLSGGTREVHVRVAVSTVDAEGAAANFAAEHDGFDLDRGVAAAKEAWAEQVAPVRVWGGTDDQQVIFASALYHSAQMPTQFSDVDGRYRGFDQAVHADPGHRYFTDMSLWDTYRTTHPLYTMIWPGLHREVLASLQRMDEQGDGLPRWPIALWDGGFMVGSPADIVLAEAALKGVAPAGVDATLSRAVEVALGRRSPAYAGRADPVRYGELGYRPAEWGDASVSTTQELAVADHALAEVARALGPEASGISAQDAEELARRAGFWANLYNAETGYFQARTEAGAFVPLGSESAWDDAYAEGNARQYRWMVPHDPDGLADTLGGEAAALELLRTFFEEAEIDANDAVEGVPEAWYWHGNEVDLHAAYLFGLWGEPGETVRWTSWIMDRWYGTGPDGLAGNDDGGTLSAWYVWAAIGLYPLAGTDRYALGVPIFDRVELDLETGRTLTIHREGKRGALTGAERVQVLLDREEVQGSLTHAALRAAEDLRFIVR